MFLDTCLSAREMKNLLFAEKIGEQEPGAVELILIADYFNVSVEYLLERTNNQQ